MFKNKHQKKIIKILKIINSMKIQDDRIDKTEINDSKASRGRKYQYSNLTLFKIFIIMKLLNIDTIKGVWRFLMDNKKIKKHCGLESDIDRSTLSRRLSDKIKPWF